MKKQLLLFVCTLISLGLFAQVEKGKVLLGVSTPISGGILNSATTGNGVVAGINSTSQKNNNGNTLFFSPSASIDFLLSYQAGSIKNPGLKEADASVNTFGLNIGFSWFLR
jgi:hypothetical protein